MTTVGDYMSMPAVAIDCRQSIAEAAEQMRALDLRHLAVLDHGELVGVLSERDILRLEARKPVDPEQLSVQQGMRPDPLKVQPDTPLAQAATTMAVQGLGSALVIDVRGRPIGVFTTTDALRALSKLARDT